MQAHKTNFVTLNVWHDGDRSVGLPGDSAEIRLCVDGLDPADACAYIEIAKVRLGAAFSGAVGYEGEDRHQRGAAKPRPLTPAPARWAGQRKESKTVTSEKEIYELVERAESVGAIVAVTHDGDPTARNPRGFIQSVQVSNLDGIGPHPMSPLCAAERLREALREPYGWSVVGTSHEGTLRVPEGWASVGTDCPDSVTVKQSH